MNIEELRLIAAIKSGIGEAYAFETKYSEMHYGFTPQNLEEEDYERDSTEFSLRVTIEKIYRQSVVLAERLGLPFYAAEILKARQKVRDLTRMVPSQWGPEALECPALAIAVDFFGPLEEMVEGPMISGLEVFETILHNSAKIMYERGEKPSNEAEVRREIFSILKCTFHDAVREIPITKLFKTFKPDLGVRSLKAAAEYKYADTEQRVKEVLDGIYADMRGYAGDHRWKTFYAVIYMTQPFYSQQQIEKEFRNVSADRNWIPILLTGPGRARTTPKKVPWKIIKNKRKKSREVTRRAFRSLRRRAWLGVKWRSVSCSLGIRIGGPCEARSARFFVCG
jgi:hypothetical protein